MAEEWYVLGSRVDMGKTTIGSALVHLLEDTSGPTIAVKPRSNYRWHMYAEDWLDWDRKGDLMSCSDTMKLNAHSSMFSPEEVELAAPCQFVSSSGWKKTLFVRCGSVKAGKRKCFISAQNSVELLKDSFDEDCYPFEIDGLRSAELMEVNWGQSYKITQSYIEGSVAQILTKKPKNIVYEGAGPKVPVWRNEHLMQNIVLISDFTISLFRNVNVRIHNKTDKLINFLQVASRLKSAPVKRTRLRYTKSEDRHQEAYDNLARLLKV